MASKYYWWLLCLLCSFFELIHLHNNGVGARKLSKFKDMKLENESKLIRAKLAADIYAEKNDTTKELGTHYAVVRTSGTFFGAAFKGSIWNLAVNGAQYSSTRMKLQNREESIEVGWTVNPSLYNDTRTRSYIYTKVGNKHCFNIYCGLFIEELFPGLGDAYDAYDDVSKQGGPILEASYVIYMELSSGDWVLKSGITGERLGYWPKNKFNYLTNPATSIEWGSKVFSPPNIASPPMGSGSKLKENIKYDAYCGDLRIMDKSNTFMPVQSTTIYTDTETYQVIDEGNVKGYGHLMLYGGVGGIKETN